MSLVNISPIEISSRVIFLTPEDMSKLALQPGAKLKVAAGLSATDAEISIGQNTNFISIGVLEALDLPATGVLSLKKVGPDSCKVGPVIGILVSRGKKHTSPPYSSQNRLLQSFLNFAAKAGGLAYVFSPSGVDIANQKITGYYLGTGPHDSPVWLEHTFPLPDVIFDRILFRSVERSKTTKQITSYFLKHEQIKYFNPKFLNKWQTFSILSQNPVFLKHLPETKIYVGPDSLSKFLGSHQTVYVKPVNGSLGKGIMRIYMVPEGYSFQYRVGKRPVSGIWHDHSQLSNGLKTFLKTPPYIMQQGLDLLKYRGRVFDIRVLMQRDGHGKWTNSASVARVGLAGSIFPNVAAGGEAVDISQVWQEIAGSDWFSSKTCALTREIGQAAGETLEKALGVFGEIGLDIGVDSNGDIWVIEINSKPSRKVFPKKQTHLKTTSLKLPMDFAKYLAGFSQNEERNLP